MSPSERGGPGSGQAWDEELAFALHLADLADEISSSHFRRSGLAVRRKADGTPVTEADERIERRLRWEIATTYPGHGVLGEEEGGTARGTDPRWILDPIDGTKNFAWGIPVWATLVALEAGGEVVVGVVSAPALGERYAARRGGGATRNGEVIRVSEVVELALARVGFTSLHEFARRGEAEGFRALVGASAEDRGIGDFYGHVLVAAGALDLMVEPAVAPWDLAALAVVVKEAGGRLTDLAGRPTIYGGNALTSNGRLHEAALAVLAGRGKSS